MPRAPQVKRTRTDGPRELSCFKKKIPALLNIEDEDTVQNPHPVEQRNTPETIKHVSQIIVIGETETSVCEADQYVAEGAGDMDPATQDPHGDKSQHQQQQGGYNPGDGCVASPKSMKTLRESEETELEKTALRVISYLGKSAATRFEHSQPDREWLHTTMTFLIQSLIPLTQQDPRKTGAVIHLEAPVCIIGDIHGDFEDFYELLMQTTVLGDFRLTTHSYLFLGDYVDRGAWGVEVCAYLVAMRCLRPHKACLLRGNHDDPLINGAVDDYKSGSFRSQCIRFCETQGKGDKLFMECNKLFKVLPLAAIVDRKLYCCHGGIPRYSGGHDDRMDVLSSDDFPEFSMVNPKCADGRCKKLEKQLMYAWDVMWSDPADSTVPCNEHGFGPNLRGGATMTYDSAALRTFLTNNNLCCLVRGHQERLSGVRLSHESQLLTVFSTSGYCGHSNNAGAALYTQDGHLHYITKSF